MWSFINALLSRLKEDIVLHLAAVVPVAYVIASLCEANPWLVGATIAIPVFAWHIFWKPYRDKKVQQREAERKQNDRERKHRRHAVQVAYRSVEEAYRIASTLTLNGVLNPQLEGRYYDELMYARNATDAVAQFIENPPPPLGQVATVAHLEAWLAVLRDVRTT